jgi:outer membrane protein OmpA-like peptidoglycan-associated protein
VKLLAITAAVAACACGGSELKSRASATGEVIARARDNGAQRCAPRELALAESHHDFALQDLDEGNFFRAKSELEVAEKNAAEALEKSPKARCNPDEIKVAVKSPQDTDGDGILDPDDKCPKVPEDADGFEDGDGCPDEDNDEDGLADNVDKCPNEPEDTDGFEDDDGCPDPDNDGDGLADSVDNCPDQAEDADGFEDDDGCPDCDNDGDGVPECPQVVDLCPNKPAKTKDGCPDYKLVKVTDKKIELKQTVYFDTARTTIKRRSFALLNEVARVLTDNPKIEVRIEGHTDSRGSDSYNLKLSDGRAASVRSYLIDRGISADRMESKGYGERVPIADNRTRVGRGQNRRVEFVITDR